MNTIDNPQIAYNREIVELAAYWKTQIMNYTATLVELSERNNLTLFGDLYSIQGEDVKFAPATRQDCQFMMKLFRNLQRDPENLKRINHFYLVLFRTCLPGKTRVYAAEPGKRSEIQAARNAWVAARDHAERCRLAYVEEKGDFFKTAE